MAPAARARARNDRVRWLGAYQHSNADGYFGGGAARSHGRGIPAPCHLDGRTRLDCGARSRPYARRLQGAGARVRSTKRRGILSAAHLTNAERQIEFVRAGAGKLDKVRNAEARVRWLASLCFSNVGRRCWRLAGNSPLPSTRRPGTRQPHATRCRPPSGVRSTSCRQGALLTCLPEQSRRDGQ